MRLTTFATKCWQGDYEKILNINRLRQMVKGNCHEFDRVVIWLNNFPDENHYQKANSLLEHLIKSYSDTLPLVRESMRERALEFPEVTKLFNEIPFRNSACEYLSTQVEKDPVVWTCGDVLVEANFDWVSVGLQLLDKNPELLSVTPPTQLGWAHDLHVTTTSGEKPVSVIETEPECEYQYFTVQRYSDHCNLYYPERMRNIQFGETHPSIGGGFDHWFEVHVCAWMENHNVSRAVLGAGKPRNILYYVHEGDNRW